MSYQSDTMEDVLRRGAARSEALSAEQSAYLLGLIATALTGVSGFGGDVAQTLQHDAAGVMLWVTNP